MSRLPVDPGVVWALALIAALAYALRSARQSNLDVRSMYWAAVCAYVGGLWGGHLMGMAVHGVQGGLFGWAEFWSGPKSYFGALLGGGAAATLYFRRHKIDALSYADAAVLAVCLGYAIGRIGCFLNGDDYGTLSHLPWAVAYPPGTEAYQAHLSLGWIPPDAAWSLTIHPVQLYASLLGLAMFLVLANYRPRKTGDRLGLFLVAYAIGRFCMERLRGDFRAILGPLSLPQLLSLLFLVLAIAVRCGTRGLLARSGSPPPDLAAAQGPAIA
ncbi:MAG TPA: prolipoprotein diacylglyceryl transferase family protein [Bryobacteraceae bacterium]